MKEYLFVVSFTVYVEAVLAAGIWEELSNLNVGGN